MKKQNQLRILSIAFIGLLFLGIFLPGTAHIGTSAQPTGHTFYVGGSGPGNYTRIQDALDNATNGDTVFVFPGHYDEHLKVDVSVILRGEDQNTTIIDGQNKNYSVISILAPDVSVTGFTVQDSGQLNNAAGIYIHANRSSIMGNTITCTQTTGMEGIWCWNTSETLIQRNTIENYYYGIALENSISSALQDNNVTGTRAWGILLGNTNESGVTGNVMTGNIGGLYLRDSHRNMIYGNTIKQNTHAIYLAEIDGTTAGNNITSNNFIRNTGPGPWFFLGNQSHSKNLWDKNYYGRTLLHPKIIYGQKKILSLPGAPFHLPPMDIVIPWFAFDRHPAQTPYI